MQQALSCPNCGSTVTVEQQFCGVCGTSLAGMVEQIAANCPNCNAPVSPGQRFCGICGTSFTSGGEPVKLARQQPKKEMKEVPVTRPKTTEPAVSTAVAVETKKRASDTPRESNYGFLRGASILFQIIGWIVLVGGVISSIGMIVFALLGGGFQPIIQGLGNIVGGTAIIVGAALLVFSIIYGIAFLAFGQLCSTVIEIAKNTKR